MRTLILAPLALPFVAAAALAQQVPTRTLTTPDAKYAEPFSNLGSLRELRDGRLVVADPTEKVLQMIDLRTGSATAIGREGAGPMEWGLPYRLFAYPGDSTLLHDLPNSRYMIIGPDGKPARTFNPIADAAVAGRGAPPPGATNGGARAGGGPIGFSFGGPGGGPISIGRLSDGRGGLYSVAPAFVRTATGMTSADSAPITRFDVNSGKIDTVAFVDLAKNSGSMSQSGAAGNQTMTIRMGSSAPFPVADDWTILPDGRVAIVRASDYHVEVVQRDGRRVKGAAVPFTPVRVTEAEKEAWREARRSARPVNVSIGNSGAGTNRQITSGAPGQVQEPDEWPATMPAFVGPATWSAPNGDIWVMRSRPARDKNPTADVFNAQGQLVGRVVMPERTRVVAFGARHVYLVRMDEDDLQYLERYALN